MGKQIIVSLGFELPGIELIDIQSDRTLFDADIILIKPRIPNNYLTTREHKGKAFYNEADSQRIWNATNHWIGEIKKALDAGKTIFVFAARPTEAYLKLELSPEHWITNYSILPIDLNVKGSSGTITKVVNNNPYFSEYWKNISKYSEYEAVVQGNFTDTLLTSSNKNDTLGAIARVGAGVLIVLPPLVYDVDSFTEWNDDEDDEVWTDEALKFGERVTSSIVKLAKAVLESSSGTPPPTWTEVPEYRLTKEAEIEEQIGDIEARLSSLKKEKSLNIAELNRVGSLRRLLFEAGKPLEEAITEALVLFGFKVENFNDGDSEFDFVFSSPEGRFLGEAEGKDNRPINIDKLSQLERNLQEDFARDEVGEYAHGVLFGNPYRLIPPEDRENSFTKKCITGAKRSGVSLVRVPDLFAPARYLKENNDPGFSEKCRLALFEGKGDVVVFPSPPSKRA